MKTIIILLLSMFTMLPFLAIAQEEEPQPEWQQGVDYVVDKVESSINGLATALEVPAKHVYEILVKQQVVIAWTSILTIILVSFLLVTSIYFLITVPSWDKPSVQAVVSMIAAAFLLIGLLIELGNVSLILTGFINPEYGAIQDIANMIK